MSKENRATVPIPDGMKELAEQNLRSLGAEAKLAMLNHLKGNASQRRKALRKWDKIRANKAEKSQEWVRSSKKV